jgi:hypothetical protein
MLPLEIRSGRWQRCWSWKGWNERHTFLEDCRL